MPPQPTIDGGESDRGSSAPTQDEAIAAAAAELPSECNVLGPTNWDDSSDLTFADQYNVPATFYWDGSDYAYRGELPEKYGG